MSESHSVSLIIPINLNARTRTTSLDGSSVLKDPSNGAMSNPSLQLTLFCKRLIMMSVNYALHAENCVDL